MCDPDGRPTPDDKPWNTLLEFKTDLNITYRSLVLRKQCVSRSAICQSGWPGSIQAVRYASRCALMYSTSLRSSRLILYANSPTPLIRKVCVCDLCAVPAWAEPGPGGSSPKIPIGMLKSGQPQSQAKRNPIRILSRARFAGHQMRTRLSFCEMHRLACSQTSSHLASGILSTFNSAFRRFSSVLDRWARVLSCPTFSTFDSHLGKPGTFAVPRDSSFFTAVLPICFSFARGSEANGMLDLDAFFMRLDTTMNGVLTAGATSLGWGVCTTGCVPPCSAVWRSSLSGEIPSTTQHMENKLFFPSRTDSEDAMNVKGGISAHVRPPLERKTNSSASQSTPFILSVSRRNNGSSFVVHVTMDASTLLVRAYSSESTTIARPRSEHGRFSTCFPVLESTRFTTMAAEHFARDLHDTQYRESKGEMHSLCGLSLQRGHSSSAQPKYSHSWEYTSL